MSNHRNQLSSRGARLRARRASRRMGMELLERRDCPAVEAFLSGGLLNVVGDEGNNVIELFQPREGVVQVVGDGRRWVFEDVDEVIVACGEGDDQATSSKPKEIVVVGAKLHFDMGAGNDQVKIAGGPAIDPGSSISPILKYLVTADLGTGADELRVDLSDADEVDLDVHSADGFDSVVVNAQLPAVQKIREAAARIAMKLGGGGNLFDISAINFDRVQFDLAAAGGDNTVHSDTDLVDGYMVEDHPPYCAIALDFGGGGNLVDLNTHGFSQTDLKLRAAGGNNQVKHEVGHTTGLRHEHTRPEARVDMNLGGGGNLVDVRMENVEDVELSIVAEPTTPEPATGGTINVYWHVIKNGADSNPRLDGVVILSSSLPGGAEAPVRNGVSTAQLTISGTISDQALSSADIDLNLGSDNDTVSIVTSGLNDVDLNVNAGDGDDTVDVALENAGQIRMPGDQELPGAVLKLNAGAGDDRVMIASGQQISGRITGIAVDPVDVAVDVGTGADQLIARIQNTDTVHWDVDAADGFDRVDVGVENAFPGFAGGVSVAVGDVNLDGGNNLVNVHTEGYGDVNLNGSFAGSDNRVDVGLVEPWVPDQSRGSSAQVSLDFGGSNNRGAVSSQGFGVWEVDLADSVTLGDSVVQSCQFMANMSAARSRATPPPTGTVTFFIDGNPAVSGSDTINVDGKGFTDVALNADTGAGDDLIGWNFVGGPVHASETNLDAAIELGPGDDVLSFHSENTGTLDLDVSAGDGNDRVYVSTAGGGAWKTSDGGASWLITIDLGAGDDTVQATVLPSVTDLVLDPFGSVRITIEAGEGNDTVEVTTNWTNPTGKYLTARPRPAQSIDQQLSVSTGAGDDTIAISDRIWPFFNSTSSRMQQNVDLGPGNDRAEISSRGYGELTSLIDAGDGDDTIASSASPTQAGAVAAVLFATLHNNNLNLGPGNDRLVINDSGYARENILADAGDGDDEVRTRVTSLQVTFLTQVTFVTRLGAGNDKLVIDTAGYRDVKLEINSGPEGDGTDSVSARLQAPGRGSRKQSARLALDGGRDTFEYNAKGYRVQSSNQTPNSVQWVFMV